MNHIDWPHEFELFMAQQPDYEGVPVWDRWLWWRHKGARFGSFSKYNKKETFEFLKEEQARYYIFKAFVWHVTDEAWAFWRPLSDKWLAHIETINRLRARSEG
jgi:hypothetical protein